MIGKIVLLAILIGIRLGYTNFIEPMLINSVYMTQMNDASSAYMLMQSIPFIEEAHFGICILLVFLIVIDIYKKCNEEGDK